MFGNDTSRKAVTLIKAVEKKRPREEGNKTGVSGATVVWFSMGFHGLLNATGRLSVT